MQVATGHGGLTGPELVGPQNLLGAWQTTDSQRIGENVISPQHDEHRKQGEARETLL